MKLAPQARHRGRVARRALAHQRLAWIRERLAARNIQGLIKEWLRTRSILRACRGVLDKRQYSLPLYGGMELAVWRAAPPPPTAGALRPVGGL